MSGLDELRQRVEAAEGHFGMIAAQSETYSARLTGLMSRMEQAHADQRNEIAALSGQVGHLETENRDLKGMLLGLLQAIETGDGSGVGAAVRDLEHRIDSMVGAACHQDAAAPDAMADTAPTDDAPLVAPAAECQTDIAGLAPAEAHAHDPLDADDAESVDIEANIAADLGLTDEDDETPADAVPAEDAGADEDVIEADGAEIDEVEKGDAEMGDAVAPGEDAEDVAVDAAFESETADALDGAEAALAEAGLEDIIAENADTATDEAPVPETIALDDTVNQNAGPANELLSRVDAVANALMEGGLDLDSDDEELTGEIAALLQDAIGARIARAESEGAEADLDDIRWDDEPAADAADDDVAAA